MPRKTRLRAESRVYHVMIRGNERKNIFLDDKDHFRFIDTLRDKHKNKTFSIYAYCLMDNHVHLLINEGSEGISHIMSRIETSYAYYFNKRYNRIGHLFQDRFKSEIIDDDSYLLAAVRYIHNNPVKAEICRNPSDFRWSSYNLYFTKNSFMKEIIDRDFILGIFSKNTSAAKSQFKVYSKQESNENFLEYHEEPSIDKEIENMEDAEKFITDFLLEHQIRIEEIKLKQNKNECTHLITYLKKKSSLPIREIANLLGIDRNKVQRTS
ncbi:MAG: transposase [Bacillota bacterium]|nr:transposase [Bacillota bacterium]